MGPPPDAGREISGAVINKAKHATAIALKQYRLLSQSNAGVLPQPPGDDGPLRLDEWQQEAYDALVAGQNVIVDAPTTSGKTRVVEAFFQDNIHHPSFRAAYTTPVKSLSNDKVREFRAMFGAGRVGIATGDIKENLAAPIVVATLESYRNSLLGTEPDLARSLVVFDEYHFLQDMSRGSAWEESIILTPPSCQLLLLSASVANAGDFQRWIERVSGRTTRLIQVTERPVPLEDLVYVQGEWLLAKELPKPNHGGGSRAKFPLPFEEAARRMRTLPDLGLTPCIIYAGRRLAAEHLARAVADTLPPLKEAQSNSLRAALEALDKETGCLAFLRSDLRRMIVRSGVAFHHSGIAPPARVAIEDLVKRGALNFCAATMGLSLGINFSVRATLISDFGRPGELGYSEYSASEILQMKGRAGRRGKDSVGFSLWPSMESWAKMGKTTRERCDSHLRNDPTTFLGLVGRGFRLGDIERFYEKSFRRFADKTVDFGLVHAKSLQANLKVPSIYCTHPIGEYSSFMHDEPDSLCRKCPIRKPCHAHHEHKIQSDLAYLHFHLNMIGALEKDQSLTSYGALARYFPQAGGLLFAQLIDRGIINGDNLLAGAELMAALALPRFKNPGGQSDYEFPFDANLIEDELIDLYPYELFPELYDKGNDRQQDEPVLRDFNPRAGAVVRAWLTGADWRELTRITTHEKFAEGDVINLIYRTGSYLQSLAQCRIEGLSHLASCLRSELLKEPLGFSIQT